VKKYNQWSIYFLFIGLFFILNILNTYMLTASILNRYIAPFTHTFLGELNAFLGNFSVLFLIMTVFFTFIKKAKSRMISLLALTFFLNFFIFAMGLVVRAWMAKPRTGEQGLTGEVGVAATDLANEGKVLVHGEIWNARSDSVIPKGERVRVLRVDGLWIHVTRQ